MKNSKTQSAPKQRDHWAAGIHSRPTKTRATLNVCLLAWFACASPVFAADASALVDIPDPSLRAAIRLTLRKAGPITAADMETIRTLDVSRSRLGYAAPIRSLEGLQSARNLQSLNLAGAISSLVSLDPEHEELFTVVAPWELTPWQLGVRPPPSTALETADLSPLAPLSSLRSLKLSGNGLTNLVVPAGLTNLQELDLSLNFQPEISSLANRPNLERLGLKFCAVTNVSFLGSMTNLRSLDLSWNYLPDFTLPAGLDQIEELTLDYMGLARYVCPAGPPKLRTLSLYMNKLANASFLGGLTNLRSLNLDWNKLPDFELPPGLGQIEHLSLNWLGLTNLVLDAGITNVRSLSLSFNALTSLTFVASMRELRSLSLGGNRVDNLGFLTNLTALENLSLGGCRVTQTEEILPHLQSLTRLQTLDLSDMGLSGSMVLSSEMTELKILFLQRNHLTTLTVPASLTNLEVLHASYNTLTHVDLPMGVVRLGTIDLSYNQLSSFSLPPNASAVKRMNFRGNPMASLDIAASQNCLQDIDISFTQVTNLDFLNGFEKLQTFGFFGNASARLVFPDGLRRLRVLLLHNYCYGGGCHWSGTENAFDTVELPASVNVAELITRGFPRERIIIRGLWMHSPVVTSNGQVTLRINGASGHQVQVQSSTNLVDWDNWQSVVLGTNGAELVDEQSAGAMRYYRLVQVPADER